MVWTTWFQMFLPWVGSKGGAFMNGVYDLRSSALIGVIGVDLRFSAFIGVSLRLSAIDVYLAAFLGVYNLLDVYLRLSAIACNLIGAYRR